MATELQITPGEILGASATVPVGLLGTEFLVNQVGTVEVGGVELFGDSLVSETITRIGVGAAVLLGFAALSEAGVVPESEGTVFTPQGLAQGGAWGLVLGATGSASMELLAFLFGPFQFEGEAESSGLLGDMEAEDEFNPSTESNSADTISGVM